MKTIIRIYNRGKIKEAYEQLVNYPLKPNVFEELENLTVLEVRSLMKLCGIEEYNGAPIQTCTENEMKMAYCIWKAEKHKKKLEPFKNKMKFWLKVMRAAQFAFWKG